MPGPKSDGEIKRPPVKITVGGVEYDAFDEDHSHSDIARWALGMGRPDAEELHLILGMMLKETTDA